MGAYLTLQSLYLSTTHGYIYTLVILSYVRSLMDELAHSTYYIVLITHFKPYISDFLPFP